MALAGCSAPSLSAGGTNPVGRAACGRPKSTVRGQGKGQPVWTSAESGSQTRIQGEARLPKHAWVPMANTPTSIYLQRWPLGPKTRARGGSNASWKGD